MHDAFKKALLKWSVLHISQPAQTTACLGIMSGLYGMENGLKGGSGKKLENQMENSPQLDRGKMAKKRPPGKP